MGRRTRVPLIAALSVALLGAPPAPADEHPWLTDVTVEEGLDFHHVRSDELRYWLPEIMAGGLCWLDYDRDGDLDLYAVQSGDLVERSPTEESWPNRLFRNDNGRFVEVTADAGVGDVGYGMGCTVGDVDGDGWADLYVSNVGPNALFRNRGDGGFDRLPAGAGVDDPGWGASAAFFDYDLDGDLDLFLVNYIVWSPDGEVQCYSGGLRDYCHPDRYDAPAPDRLLRNRGDGSFEDVTERAGLSAAYGNGLGVTVADLDNDGLPDVYVANDGMANQLWHNLGDGTFSDIGLLAGVAVNRVGTPEAGMGVQAFDVDGDLDQDLFVTHLRSETNTLYVNLGDGQFSDRTAASGLGAASLGATGFGFGFSDLDADGLPDLFVANGRVGRGLSESTDNPFAEPDQLYRGIGSGRFELLADSAIAMGVPSMASRGVALGDADLDGDVDVAILGSGASLRLLMNQVGTAAWWSAAHVLGPQGGAEIGARVTLRTPESRAVRIVQPAYGYCSAHESRVHFGLGTTERIDSVEVDSPGGQRRLYRAPPSRSILVLAAPRGDGADGDQTGRRSRSGGSGEDGQPETDEQGRQ